MKKISELEMLKDCLENRSPMLYLGAGFSLNSINKSGEALESAAGLCKLLYQRFWGKDNAIGHCYIIGNVHYAKYSEHAVLR